MNAPLQKRYDAVVVGAGPNGLAAAITLVDAGLSTLLVERADTPGGGARSSEVTLPSFIHDVCSAVHPLALCSPFFRTLDLGRHGLTWIHSPYALTHILNDGSTAVLERSVEATAERLRRDRHEYLALMRPWVDHAEELFEMFLGPLHFPAQPLLYARFGLAAIQSMKTLAWRHFVERSTSALLAGIAAHGTVRLDAAASSSFALMLAIAGHHAGWPIARSGSRALADALVSHYRSLGGELLLHRNVSRISELPSARAYLFDISPTALISIAEGRLSGCYERRLARFRYGPGVFKVDWALREPIPWRAPECRQSITVHLAGDLEQIAAAIRAAREGRMAERPFVLLAQPSLVDPSRAPQGKHTAWAYCHVPHGDSTNVLDAIEAQIERHAPGFREVILARSTRNAIEMEHYDPNYVGGDINAGSSDLKQLFFRPVAKLDPYATSAADIFLCSSSTPPGGGVHGMCGYWAAQSALKKRFGREALSIATEARAWPQVS